MYKLFRGSPPFDDLTLASFSIVSGRRRAHMGESLRPRFGLAMCLESLGSEGAKLPFSTPLLGHFYGVGVQGSFGGFLLPLFPYAPVAGRKERPNGEAGETRAGFVLRSGGS